MKNIFKCMLIAVVSSSPLFSADATQKAQQDSVVVIGSGIGALTSAIYLARGGVKTIVIEGKNPGGALALSPSVQNWPGEYDISGVELMDKIRTQAERNGVIFSADEVTEVDFSSYPFAINTRSTVDLDKKEKYQASACVIATGSEPNRLGAPGEQAYWLKGVYACAVCDGALFKGKTVAVVGGGDAALVEAEYLSQLAGKVYILVRSDKLKANEKGRIEALKNTPNVEFLFSTKVKEIVGDGSNISRLILDQEGKKKDLSVDGLFLAIGSQPSSTLFKGKVAMDSSGYIQVGSDGATSVPGVYAVGDVVDPTFKQAVSAAGAGAKAALASQQYVFSHKAPVKGKLAQKDSVSSEDLSFPAKVIEIKDADHFNKEVSTSQIPVVVDFYASWCGPCRHIAPILESYAQQLQGKVKILKVNVNTCSDLANAYQIRAMPTMIALDSSGRVHERRTGAPEIIQYLKMIK